MTLTSQPLVSVITPVYNTEKYLAECIESVLSQTYQNWEYVIVNNRSTDNSLEIAKRYAQRNVRVRIHNNDKFLNLMQNWNHAMRQVSHDSKYCKVVHADDWLFPECIARMVEVAEAHPSVGIVGAYRLDETKVNLDGLPYPSTVIPGHDICRWQLMVGPYIFGSPTSLLIRSDLIKARNNFYNESNIHADKEACFELLRESDFGFVHQVLTFTRRHNETTTSSLSALKTHNVGRLFILQKYGPIYLTESEYQKCFNATMYRYYKFLTTSLLRFPPKDFMNHQKKELAKLGHTISVPRLLLYMFLEILNLKDTLKILANPLIKSRRTR